MKSLKINLPNLTLIILCCFLFFSPGLFAQIKVTRVESQAQLAGKNGVVYALPRTVVITDICVSKSQQFAGPLAEFAAEIMGIDEVITGDAVSYSIENAVIRKIGRAHV